ncbi:MAG: bifunctional 5,10-methylenetetrahydrofolate dehydrogenase/5,10-methenyltetrahydrofolate cyclohydrolase [Pyrinomonadaceae bacterium]
MPAQILSGKPVAEAIKQEVRDEIAGLGYRPGLTVMRVGEDPASAVYVGSKVKTAEEIGINSEHIHLDETVTEAELLAHVDSLNGRDDVDGILVQLPLPNHINEQTVLERIDPKKDVDGFHPVNAGRLMQGHSALVPCTPAGVIEILQRSDIQIAGANAVVVGRSNIVGKPMAILLLNENATVTVCHSKTRDLAAVCASADILVAAIGRAGFIQAEHIKEGATVIDVGINSIGDRGVLPTFFDGEELDKRLAAVDKRGATLVGDVSYKDAILRAAYLTPVPGGVGLLTVAILMKNTVTAAKARSKMNRRDAETPR